MPESGGPALLRHIAGAGRDVKGDTRMPPAADMQHHFSEVARVYRTVRTTDEAPIRYVAGLLGDRPEVEAADIGCGDGRYDLLLFRHLPGLRLICVDANPEMLARAADYLRAHDIDAFEIRTARIEELDLGEGALDAVFSFNAVHHFDFPTFLDRAGRALRPDGRLFVYTRTPEQNAGSVWGRYFPKFLDKETRLYTLEQMTRWVEDSGFLELVESREFRYPRERSLERLLEQVAARHYSTFSLYEEDELAAATAEFAEILRERHADPERIAWEDANTLLVVGRRGG